ncbi:hypothetical protein H4R99_007146 [Coemansia sp. RSA 1722]|nr:hypothetical protein IWW45_007784 [Coemansia sp. RSA 485]KAJ2590312.1 hypothetical protein H4R99_007146 [Coemansia sp. RSA 1722]KAJ2638051.1 hypothetical protein GGF40_001940 [Coemansia sp. RSA 1286]
MVYSSLSSTNSSNSSTSTLYLDSLRTHHTQALVNVVSSNLHPTPINANALLTSLIELRRHLESPLSCAHSHPATETNAAEVLEHILLCWVCARAAQTDVQNYDIEKTVPTADRAYDKYAEIPVTAISEAIQCTSYLATMSVGIAAVAKTSIPASLTLALGFVDDHSTLTNAFRALTKLCTKHSVKRPIAGARWESDTGIYSVVDAFSRAQSALGLRNRFDTLANAAFSYTSELVTADILLPASVSTTSASISSMSSRSTLDSLDSVCLSQESRQRGIWAERLVTSALGLVNALVGAHTAVDARLRLRKELLDTALYKCFKLLEQPEFELSRAFKETRRFRRAYAADIRQCDPQPCGTI